jgi:hypothetical protein
MNTPGLRASDADRDKVAAVLQAAYIDGRISQSEHTERLEAALTAKTFDDLLPLTADLVPVPASHGSARTGSSSLSVPLGGDSETERMTAVLSTVKRNGKWRVRTRSAANNLLGTVDLDFTQAVFATPVIEVNVTQLLGTVVLRVPVGATVRDETTNVLGSTSIKGIGESNPAQPTIVITGTNILGEVKVRGPKRGLHWGRVLP